MATRVRVLLGNLKTVDVALQKIYVTCSLGGPQEDGLVPLAVTAQKDGTMGFGKASVSGMTTDLRWLMINHELSPNADKILTKWKIAFEYV